MIDGLAIKISEAELARRNALASVKSERKALKLVRLELADIAQAREVLQATAAKVQAEAHARIAGVVTRCLKAVWGPEAYEFKINFVERRGKTEADLVFVRDGMEVDPQDAAGGAVVEVVAFALRLACLMLQQPPGRRLLVMDEPFRCIHPDLVKSLQQLLIHLAKEMDAQFVIVTHHQQLPPANGKTVDLRTGIKVTTL